MNNDFSTLLTKQILNYTSLDKKVETTINIIHNIVNEINSISPHVDGFKLFEYEIKDFKQRSRNKWKAVLNLYFDRNLTMISPLVLDIDVFNENNYELIFDFLFSNLLQIEYVYNLVQSANVENKDDNPFTKYLIENLDLGVSDEY